MPKKACPEQSRRVYIRTFGWPMDAVLYDFRAVFEQDLVK